MVLKNSNFKNLLFASALVTLGTLLPNFAMAMDGPSEPNEYEALLRKYPEIYHRLMTRKYREKVCNLRGEIQQLLEQKKAAKRELPSIEKERKEFQTAIEAIEQKKLDRELAYEEMKKKYPDCSLEEAQRHLKDEQGQIEQEIQQHRKSQTDLYASTVCVVKAWEDKRDRVLLALSHLTQNMATIDFDLDILRKKFEQLNIQVNADPVATIEKRIGQKIYELERLYDEHIALPEGHRTLALALPKLIIESLGIKTSSTMHLDSRALAHYFARTIELPCVIEIGEARKTAYLKQAQLVLEGFAQRIAEDLDALEILDSITKDKALDFDGELDFSFDIANLLTRGAKLPDSAKGPLNPEIPLLQQILGPTISAKNLEGLLDEAPHGLLGLCIDSLSDQPPCSEPRKISRAMEFKSHMKNKSEYGLEGFYSASVLSILASHINKVLLERIIEDCQAKAESLASSRDDSYYY